MIKLALYARTSTEENQDPVVSFGWQKDRSEALARQIGAEITCVFYDAGISRSVHPKHRPEATAMFREAARPDRRFDGIIFGEPSRISGTISQGEWVCQMAVGLRVRLFDARKGEIDPKDPTSRLTQAVENYRSESEVSVLTERVWDGMAAKARRSDHSLGGRTPFGYLRVPLGIHPHPAKARDGLQAFGLDLDPQTAPVVKRIFSEYLEGLGIRAIAEGLTRDGIPSPSAYRPEQNMRAGRTIVSAWSRSAVRAIIGNPTYTGKRVWAKQARQYVLADMADADEGRRRKMVWRNPEEWVWPLEDTHPAIVSAETFAAAQAHRSQGHERQVQRALPKGRREYALRGRAYCFCGRKMENTRINGLTYLRCRLSTGEYARNEELERSHPKTSYLREDNILPALNQYLAGLFSPENREETVSALLAASQDTSTGDLQEEALRRQLAEADKKLTNLMRSIESGADPTIMAPRINQVAAEKQAAQQALSAFTRTAPPNRAEILALLLELGEIAEALEEATPEEMAAIYRAIGLRLDYQPGSAKVLVTVLSENCVSEDRSVRLSYAVTIDLGRAA